MNTSTLGSSWWMERITGDPAVSKLLELVAEGGEVSAFTRLRQVLLFRGQPPATSKSQQRGFPVQSILFLGALRGAWI